MVGSDRRRDQHAFHVHYLFGQARENWFLHATAVVAAGSPEIPSLATLHYPASRFEREIFLEKEHVSAKGTVQMIKKPLCVLLFAGAAGREFQFVRTQFVREADARRAEVSVCLQLTREGVVQDVSPDSLLKHFPEELGLA